ncbi:CA [Lepeophtheirus salmonis]|uniref:Carbonic anhydrase n=1 Tax=Lepeophtheirus salmonis TaxID=72036 RepID=A0A7R8CJ09_LEPSM|nr:CA [Lepeophtheirus salmonis]CAF2831133.1 CA [Lepeophtheirus salmonis]
MKLSHTILICLTIFFRLSVSQQKSPNEKYWDSFDVMKICNSGVKQSPINLEDRSTVKGKGSPITFMNYDVAHNFSMKNTGKTAKLSLKDASFHWGDMDKYGSEHIIDGFQYPIEAHLVHFNTKYGATIEEALSVANKSDNLAVLGLKDIQSEGTKVDVKGSLTTPRCNEVVAWTVFKKKQMISEEQLGEFRKLIGEGEPLVNNYRDIQKFFAKCMKESKYIC